MEGVYHCITLHDTLHVKFRETFPLKRLTCVVCATTVTQTFLNKKGNAECKLNEKIKRIKKNSFLRVCPTSTSNPRRYSRRKKSAAPRRDAVATTYKFFYRKTSAKVSYKILLKLDPWIGNQKTLSPKKHLRCLCEHRDSDSTLVIPDN